MYRDDLFCSMRLRHFGDRRPCAAASQVKLHSQVQELDKKLGFQWPHCGQRQNHSSRPNQSLTETQSQTHLVESWEVGLCSMFGLVSSEQTRQINQSRFMAPRAAHEVTFWVCGKGRARIAARRGGGGPQI